MRLICWVFGHRVVTAPGPAPGSTASRNWKINWHYRCLRCGATQ